MALALLFGATGGTADLGFAEPSIATVLWARSRSTASSRASPRHVRTCTSRRGACRRARRRVVDTAGAGARPARPPGDPAPAASGEPSAIETPLTAAETRLRGVARGLAVAFGALGACSDVAGLACMHGTREAFAQLPFVDQLDRPLRRRRAAVRDRRRRRAAQPAARRPGADRAAAERARRRRLPRLPASTRATASRCGKPGAVRQRRAVDPARRAASAAGVGAVGGGRRAPGGRASGSSSSVRCSSARCSRSPTC